MTTQGAGLHPEMVEVIEYEIKYSMYYLEYPDELPAGIWKDGAGDSHYIREMGLDHLKAAVNMVERDIKRLERSGRPAEVMDVLIPKARGVLGQLRSEFARKAHL